MSAIDEICKARKHIFILLWSFFVLMIFSCLGHTSRICEIHRKIKICLYKRYTYILSAIKAFYNQSKVKWFTNSKVWELKIPFMCERTNAQIFDCMLYFPTIHWNGFWGYFNYLSYKDVLYKKELSRLKMAFTLN